MRRITILMFLLLSFVACQTPQHQKEVSLYNAYCASCHIAPDITSLPEHIWESQILPEMGTRMGIRTDSFNPLANLSFKEQEKVLKLGIYPTKPTISRDNWHALKNYILYMAPDSLESNPTKQPFIEATQFTSHPISLDSIKGAFYTFLKYDSISKTILLGDMQGVLSRYNYLENTYLDLGNYGSAITDFTTIKNDDYITTVGILDPSEIEAGRIFIQNDDKQTEVPHPFHRPVATLVHDFNEDGSNELVVCEFGDLSGQLSLLALQDDKVFKKSTLLAQPGAIQVLASDMNADGKDDIVVMTTQGDEGITILFQENDLSFRAEKVIRFSPVYGSSWFELVDYDGDGDQDIITVNGDNADKSYVPKPYHGLRIHINKGNNLFEETYFYPMNGATRFVSEDYDMDGDIDFAMVSTFPDYTNEPEYSFVYLENTMAEKFQFKAYGLKDAMKGRWFLIDSGDIDEDGDVDIILSAFSYAFTPIPKELKELWDDHNIDVMILENRLQ